MIKVASIQMASRKNDERDNVNRAIHFIRKASEQNAKIVCLPELFNCGYFLEDRNYILQHAKNRNSSFIKTFQQVAQKKKIILIVPFPEMENNLLYNSAVIIDEQGSILQWKRKSFLWGKEKNIFTPGPFTYTAIPTTYGKIGILICYEIEFPEPARILALQDTNMIFVPSVWSKEAENRWDIQLPARALDNQLYVIGCNTIGDGICGKSKVVDSFGKVLHQGSSGQEEIIYGLVDEKIIESCRHQIPYLNDLHLYRKNWTNH